MAKGKKTGGRYSGTPNKFTSSVKEVFQTVFDELQSDKVANLKTWALANPSEFYKLIARQIPTAMEVKAEVGLTHITGVQILPPHRIENN